MSKLLRTLLYGFLALAALAAIALSLLSTRWFHDVLERRAIAALEGLTGARVEARAFRFTPAIFEMTFRGLVLHGNEPCSAPPLFSARTVVVGLNPFSFARRRLLLRSLAWEDAEIHLRVEPDGSTNIPGPKLSFAEGEALAELVDLSIGRVAIARTDLFWNDRRFPIELDARGLAVQLRLDRGRRYLGYLSSSGTTLTAPNWALPTATITSQFEFSRTNFNVTSVGWHSPGLDGRASLKVLVGPSPEASVTYQVSGALAELARALRLEPVASGNVNLEGQAEYRNAEWAARGRIQARQLRTRGLAFDLGRFELSAGYSVEPSRIEISNLRISALSGVVSGEGNISLESPSPKFELRAQLHALDLDSALQAFPEARAIRQRLRLAASVQGAMSVAWTGKFENFYSQFNLQFQPRGGEASGALPLTGSARGIATLAKVFSITIQRADFQTSHSNLTVQGVVEPSQSRLAVQFDTSAFQEWQSLAEFFAELSAPIPLRLQSTATFSGTVNGPIGQPEIRGRLGTGAFEYRGSTWDGLSASLAVSPRSLEMTSGVLRRGASTLIVDAAAALEGGKLNRQAPFHVTAHAERMPLEGLEASLGPSYKLSGRMTGRLTLSGTPSHLAATGFAEIDQGQVFGETFDSLSANLRVTESVLNLEGIQLKKGKGRLTGAAAYSPNSQAFSMDLRGAGFSAADFHWPAGWLGRSNQIPAIEGVADFDLHGHGAPAQVELRSDWKILGVRLQGTPLGNLQGNFNWEGRKLLVQGRSHGPGGDLNFNGNAQAKGNWPFELTGEYSNLRADAWIRSFLDPRFNARLTSSGSFTLRGPFKEPDQIEIRSQVRSLAVYVSDLTWTNAQPFELRYSKHVLTASRFEVREPSTSLVIEGSLRFGALPELALTAQGEAEAKLLSLIHPALHATGRSKMSLRVNGNLAHPLVYGTLTVQDLSLNYDDLPFRLSGLNGEIQLVGERATTQALRGVSGGGSVTLSGSMIFSTTPRFEIRADLDQVRVQYPADFTSLLTGNLRLAGTTEDAQLGGELTVRQVFARQNFNVLSLVAEAGGPGQMPPIGVSSALATKTHVNIQVVSVPEVRLETRDFSVVADIDVRLQGTLQNPVEVGTIHILSGEAVVRGNQFKLNRGDITMSSPFRTRPVLDLEATTRVDRYDLTIDLSGPFEQVKVAYRSDPPLSTADILSLLALGYTRQQGELNPTGSEHLSSVGASALLSEALSNQATGRITRLFGVSRVKIDPNVGGPLNQGGARVTVEERVTRDLTLTYVTNTAGSQQRVIQFDWAFGENVSLLGIRDQNGVFGLELRFRRRFK